MASIELKNVSYTYNKSLPSKITAVDDVSLKIDSGITGLIGHTGSGKSTLVQMLNGLIKPDQGEILLNGNNIWADPKKIRDIRFKVGLVMQYPEYQLFADTVEDDIAFGPKNMGIEGEKLNETVESAAFFAGISKDILKKSPFELSGGQKRRVALAGIIAMSPEILVLDEPAAGLDPAGRRDILGGIKVFSKIKNTTVIIVSHSMEDMAMYCDDIIVMAKSKVIAYGTCSEVFSQHELLTSTGLDVPQITRIAAALKKNGIDIGDDIYTVNYAVDKLIEKYKK